jgi:V/A-type H+-transporting ATPase subunit I
VQVEEEIERTERSLDALAERLDELEMLSDVEHTALLAEKQKKELAATEKCAVLTGWCPTDERARVIRVLESVEAAYDFAQPAEGEEPPVLLKNNRFARNFEWVVGMYSYPAYGKFDPTLVMSIFYMIIFGLMFADAGYGLVLSAACFLLVRFTHPREGMQRFLLMFGYCGLSCIVCGVLFGSYFGNFPLAFLENFLGQAPAQLPNWSLLPSEAANVAILFDPLQNPMGFLIVSLGIGAVHLLAGMAVQGYILCRRGQVLDAIFDIGSYWLLFAGIATFALGLPAGVWLTLGGVLAILLTQGRSRKGIAGKLIGGFGGLYNLINFASDLLSYSRILALGLASAVVGQVVNILATLKGGSFIGFILMIVVFCVGHLLNLVINVLGTFVHTARLQYIEFFGKFYEDGGIPFRPIKVADRYSEDTTPEAPETVSQNQL